jgi:hypothetical protein
VVVEHGNRFKGLGTHAAIRIGVRGSCVAHLVLLFDRVRTPRTLGLDVVTGYVLEVVAVIR